MNKLLSLIQNNYLRSGVITGFIIYALTILLCPLFTGCGNIDAKDNIPITHINNHQPHQDSIPSRIDNIMDHLIGTIELSNHSKQDVYQGKRGGYYYWGYSKTSQKEYKRYIPKDRIDDIILLKDE